MFFSSDQIASATKCPQRNVASNWRAITAALEEFGIDDMNTEIAAAATVAVETGSFMPLIEKHADARKQPDIWKMQERYWNTNYMGRGFIQLTGIDNYKTYAKLLNIDIVNNPDLVLIPDNSARILACYFRSRLVNKAANERDWKRVRKIVNGGLIGYDRFAAVVKALGGFGEMG